jgi:lytic murein transglycosylase
MTCPATPRLRTRIRLLSVAGALACLCTAGLEAAPARAQQPGQAAAQQAVGTFSSFLETLWPQAQAAGVSRVTFDSVVAGLKPDPSIVGVPAAQPEFLRSVGSYVRERDAPARVARGRAEAERWGSAAQRVAERTGVPGAILLAIWGMETDYGRFGGGKDVLRSLASLAFAHPERPLYAQEFVAALTILETGALPRERLTGSWAGAMGQPQFMPSTFLAHAVKLDGPGRGDIWASPGDVLASIGHLLEAEGWTRGLPWGAPAVIPPGFDYAAHRQTLAQWKAAGVVPAEGGPWPGDAQATLYFPAGARGPAFLLTANFFVLKEYNTSDSYALSVGLLADAIDGATSPAWPKDDPVLTRAQQAALQRGLTALGYYDGVADGKIGPAMRAAIHAFQKATGYHPADAHPSPTLLKAVQAAAATR